jgi:cell fate (sporulation/competence/biofilm development) regulator YlbF (YheA/YmcA/DUF963 family)
MLQEKAQDLGRLIGQSPEYQAVRRTSEALTADTDAVAALQRMESLRGEAQQLLARGEQPGPAMEQELDQLLTRVQGNAAYQRAIAAQENFDKVMLRVNEWILEGIKRGATSSIITLG